MSLILHLPPSVGISIVTGHCLCNGKLNFSCICCCSAFTYFNHCCYVYAGMPLWDKLMNQSYWCYNSFFPFRWECLTLNVTESTHHYFIEVKQLHNANQRQPAFSWCMTHDAVHCYVMSRNPIRAHSCIRQRSQSNPVPPRSGPAWRTTGFAAEPPLSASRLVSASRNVL